MVDITFKTFTATKLNTLGLAAASGGQMENKPMFQRTSLSSSTGKRFTGPYNHLALLLA
jgi:hypothetical protein